jgi:hypothetical protein
MHAIVRRVRPRVGGGGGRRRLRVGETGHTVVMTKIEEPTPPAPIPEPIPSPDPVPPPNPGPDPPELTPVGSTPQRRQDIGKHGYGGMQQEKKANAPEETEHPLEDPGAVPHQGNDQQEDVRRQ